MFHKSISSSIYIRNTWPNRNFLYLITLRQFMYFCCPIKFSGDDPVGYNCLYSFSENFDLIFGKTLCTFLSAVCVGSELSLRNWFVLSISKHFSVYFSLFIITALLPLSAFKIAISLLSESSRQFFYICMVLLFWCTYHTCF